MNEKDYKKIEKIICDFKDDIKQEFRHQIGVQSENFQRKLDIVVEGQQMLSEKIDRVKTELEERIGCVEHKIDIVAAKTDENTVIIDLLSEKIDVITARIDKLDARIDKLDARMDKLDTRMDKSDAKMDNLVNKIDAIATDLADHRRDTEAHSTIYKVKEEQ